MPCPYKIICLLLFPRGKTPVVKMNGGEVPTDSAYATSGASRLTRRCSVGYPKKTGIRNQIRSESYTASLALLPLS
ncbi:MAG: hypothetical protein QNJ63_25650, partial [Calothrix sp. MO_192.B10]|nr:hypothetical protein [Calothrix sp. MO_192.B10]